MYMYTSQPVELDKVMWSHDKNIDNLAKLILMHH